MAKNKPDNIDSFSGLFTGNVPSDEKMESTKEIINKTPTHIKRQKGRPKVDREKKKQYAISIPPSIYDKAMERAYHEHKSMSGLVTELLAQYIEE